MACGILVPRPGIKPAPSCIGSASLNHWTTGEVPKISFPFVIPLSLSVQADSVSDNSVILKTLWVSCGAYWGVGGSTPLDKSYTHKFFQDKSFPTIASKTTETVLLSFLEALPSAKMFSVLPP